MVAEVQAQGGRDAVLALHRAGELDRARAGYERLLETSPDDPDLLGLLGVLAIQQRCTSEAGELLAQALRAPPTDPRIYLRNLNNMLALLKERGEREAAHDFVRAGLPDWPGDVVPDTAERRTILSLCEALSLLGEPERALALLESALGQLGADADALTLAGALRLKCGDPTASLTDLREACECNPTNWRALANLSLAERTLGNDSVARDLARRCARAGAVYVAPRRGSHKATILTLNRAPAQIPSLEEGLHGLHFTHNYIAQASRLMADEFRFASVFADLPAPLPPLPEADVVYNNIASGEVLGVPGSLDRVLEVVRRIDRPVINHPVVVSQTTRQKAADLLQGVPGLRVPHIMRFARDMDRFGEIAAEIAANFIYPVILRQVAVDESSKSLLSDSKTAVLLSNSEEVRRFLAQVSWPQFYAIQYIDLRKPDGNFRKLRAAVFPDEIIIIACGFYSEWMVAGWRANEQGHAFYGAFPRRVDDMHRTLEDPEAELGPAFIRTLEAIRVRMPLEVYGIDFDMDDDGRVVLFEAQATMILLMPSVGVPEHLQLPKELGDRVNGAFRRLVGKKTGATV